MAAHSLKLTAFESLASFSEVTLLVRLRLLEMADTYQHADLGRIGPSTKATWWPEINDKWRYARDGSIDRPYLKERYRPGAEAISRADESIAWIARHVTDDERRTLLSGWLQCQIFGTHRASFSRWCKKNGKNRRTADRQVSKAIEGIAAELCKSGVLLRPPRLSRVSTFLPKQGRDQGTIGRVAHHCQVGEPWQLDDLPEIRDLSWARKQNERREKRAAHAA
jgi:hypothetical protein